MTTEQKKELLKYVIATQRTVSQATTPLTDGKYDHRYLPSAHMETLRDCVLGVVGGLAMLEAQLTAEIGTDNL